jgi:hypothetical protein
MWYCGYCWCLTSGLDAYCDGCGHVKDELAEYESDLANSLEGASQEILADSNHDLQQPADTLDGQDEASVEGSSDLDPRIYSFQNWKRSSSDCSDISQASSLASIPDSIFSCQCIF